MIDREFHPRRFGFDVARGVVGGGLLRFTLSVSMERPVPDSKLQMALVALILFATVFSGLFERYFPPVEESKENSGEQQ